MTPYELLMFFVEHPALLGLAVFLTAAELGGKP
jgi:hypothetical protein